MAARSILSEGVQVLALKIQESLMQGDVCARLRDAINDYGRAQGNPWSCYYIDHDGDGDSGNVVYSCGGDVRMSTYEIGDVAGKAACNVDFAASKNVVPVTTYQPEAEDADHYTAMGESFTAQKLYVGLPIYERFISKTTRKAASSSDFAGKNRSFPILKSEDVSAALHSLGRVGADNYSADVIRTNIKKIAKAKGFTLPDSLKDAQESASVKAAIENAKTLSWADQTGRSAYTPAGSHDNGSTYAYLGSGNREGVQPNGLSSRRETLHNSTWKPDGVLLQESARFQELPRLQEGSAVDYAIKLMSPGRGTSGYYPSDVLKKASEAKVFKAGTQMFWNHDTDSQEAERPEGDLDRLAAVTTTDAKYDESGHDGPGLYARAKVFSDYADQVKEKGPHIGLSIRAGGSKDEAAVGPDGRKGVITALRNAASVDFVTKAGRDGKIFTESAVEEGDGTMTKEEIQAIFKESLAAELAPLKADNKRLTEALAVQEAPGIVKKFLEGVRLPDATKTQIAEKFASPAVTAMIPMKEGKIDEPQFTKMIEAEAVRQRDYLMALGWNTDAASQGLRMSEAEIAADDTKTGKNFEEAIGNVVDIFVGAKKEGDPLRESARTAFAKGRVA